MTEVSWILSQDRKLAWQCKDPHIRFHGMLGPKAAQGMRTLYMLDNTVLPGVEAFFRNIYLY